MEEEQISFGAFSKSGYLGQKIIPRREYDLIEFLKKVIQKETVVAVTFDLEEHELIFVVQGEVPSVSTNCKVCPKSQECDEFRNDGKDLCHSDWQNCIHYKSLTSIEGK